jgi:phospholipid/cholesterol/gamma-HCH transport system substrate-binding protein
VETRASYVLIGSFALGLVALAVMSVLWLGKLSLDREWDLYDIVFEEAITGLGKGGAVQYNGIQLGEVLRLSLDAKDPRKVIARVRITAGTPVKVDTHATLTYTGLTGVAVIQLTGGTAKAQRLRPPEGAEAAVIIADDSALQNLIASGEGIAMNADKLLLQLASLLRDDNVEALSATFANLKTVSASVAGRSEEISQALTNIASASREFKGTLARAEHLITTLDGDVPALVAQAQATLVATQQASARLADLVDENRSAIGTFTNEGLAEIAPAVSDMRATLKPLRALAERLHGDPGLLLQPASQTPEHAPP